MCEIAFFNYIEKSGLGIVTTMVGGLIEVDKKTVESEDVLMMFVILFTIAGVAISIIVDEMLS